MGKVKLFNDTYILSERKGGKNRQPAISEREERIKAQRRNLPK